MTPLSGMARPKKFEVKEAEMMLVTLRSPTFNIELG
jgi:hypothetical protein